MAAHILLIGAHLGTGETLGYVLDGDHPMDAIVNVDDPLLQLRCPLDYLETGNSLTWLTEADLHQPELHTEWYHHEPQEEIPS